MQIISNKKIDYLFKAACSVSELKNDEPHMIAQDIFENVIIYSYQSIIDDSLNDLTFINSLINDVIKMTNFALSNNKSIYKIVQKNEQGNKELDCNILIAGNEKEITDILIGIISSSKDYDFYPIC